MLGKIDALKTFIHTCSADIIIGTETWLSPDIADSELALSTSFALFRKDRISTRGGGVLVAIKHEFQPSAISIDSPLELVWVNACLGSVTCLIGACYRPPDCSPDFVELLSESLELITLKFPNSVIFLAGDFNYPAIDWPTLSVNSTQNTTESVNFANLTRYFQLTQLVLEPTRCNHILDLIFTTHPDQTITQVLEEISDHKLIHCTFSLPRADRGEVTKQIRNFARADIEKISRMMTSFVSNFEVNFNNQNADENWTAFRDKLKEIESACVPLTTLKTGINDPWFTREVKTCLNKKKRAYRKAARSKSADDWLNYKKVSSEVKIEIHKAKDKYFNKTLPDTLSSDPKKFWRVLNLKNNQAVPQLKDDNGIMLPLDECAESFSKHFQDNFTRELPLHSITSPHIPITHQFEPITITVNGVTRAIERLSTTTSPGPDGITTKILKITCPASAYLLTLIFQQSLETGCVPKDWKAAHIKPLFKSGDKTHHTNYRPISLTSICSKLFEHILYSHIMTYLNQNNLLLQNQHGFRQNLSCQTQLYELLTDLHKSLHISLDTDAVFIDFTKAFDRVPHKRLLLKINDLNLDYNTTRWIGEFITNRTQSVKLNNYISHPIPVTSGVPQGSVLGPLLFLIYINDIETGITSSIRLFADDCVIYRQITNSTDVSALQSDLTQLSKWCDTWQMGINLEKTKYVRFSCALDRPLNRYTINDRDVQSASSYKYLGIYITSDLSWNSHKVHNQ